MEYYELTLSINSKDIFNDSIIDPISFKLIDWGVNENLINWQIYKNEAKLQINVNESDEDYLPISIDYLEFQQIIDLCYEEEFKMIIKLGNDSYESIIEYLSNFNDNSFTTKEL